MPTTFLAIQTKEQPTMQEEKKQLSKRKLDKMEAMVVSTQVATSKTYSINSLVEEGVREDNKKEILILTAKEDNKEAIEELMLRKKNRKATILKIQMFLSLLFLVYLRFYPEMKFILFYVSRIKIRI